MDGDVQIRRATSGNFGALGEVFHDAVSVSGRGSIRRLWTDAGQHAKGPFQKTGFVVTAPETVIRNGEAFRRFQMEKLLDD